MPRAMWYARNRRFQGRGLWGNRRFTHLKVDRDKRSPPCQKTPSTILILSLLMSSATATTTIPVVASTSSTSVPSNTTAAAVVATPAVAVVVEKPAYTPTFEAMFTSFINAVNAPLDPPLEAEFIEHLKMNCFKTWGNFSGPSMGTPKSSGQVAGGSSKKGGKGKTGYHVFLSEFNKSHPGCNIIKDGPEAWKLVTEDQKKAYKAQAAVLNAAAAAASAVAEGGDVAASSSSKGNSPKKSSLNGYHMYMRELKSKAPEGKLAMSSTDLSAAWKKVTKEEKDAYKAKALKFNAEANGTAVLAPPS